MSVDYIDRVEDAVRACNAEVIAVRPDSLVIDAAREMSERRAGIALVCAEDGRIVGVLSERDIVRALIDNLRRLSSLLVSQISTENPNTCCLEDDIREIIHKMIKGGFRHMPIIENGKVVGVVEQQELLAYLLSQAEQEQKAFALSHLDYL